MRRVTLEGTDLTTSALGFGAVGGGLSEPVRLGLYAHAFEVGITHFDTARTYGLGHAERTLGTFLAGKRDRVTVTTKVGILPPRPNPLLNMARHVVRRVERVLPGLGAAAKQRAAGMMTASRCFSVEDARASFETSLRELNTDYVDVLLLHECTAADVQPELVEYLQRCITEGKARAIGIATSAASTEEILARRDAFPGVVQMAGGIMSSPLLTVTAGRARITHSVFDGLQPLRRALEADPSLSRQVSDAVGRDCADASLLSALFLGHARRANPEGVLLFSSSKPQHIDANLVAASAEPPSAEALDRFADAARHIVSGSGDRP